MSWSINTAWKNRSVAGVVLSAVAILGAAAPLYAQDVSLRAPSGVVAGSPASIQTGGSGSATFYLIGPTISIKRDAQLGQSIELAAKELKNAGLYTAIACAGTCSSVEFFVEPAKPSMVTFLVHPSRAPVAQKDVVSGVALVFDEFHNLAITPATVNFQWNAKGSQVVSRSVQTQDGIAWFRTNSGKSAGPLEITATINDAIAKRVVQQVASDPCNLRITGQRTPKGIVVQTEPVRDCSGNPVPDGTVVTFTAKNGNETSTVDAPIKQDVAQARIIANGPVVVSAASGVVMGNELRIGGRE
jgi:hypothetical protein